MNPRKTKPKSSKLSQVHRSQKALLRAFKHQTEELGHLRKLILNRFPYDPVFAQKSEVFKQKPQQTWAEEIEDYRKWFLKRYPHRTAPNGPVGRQDVQYKLSTPFAPTDSIDSPQPKL